MVFVYRLRVINASEHRRDIVLRYPDQGLDDEEYVGDQAQNGVWGLEVLAAVRDLVVFDYDEASDESEDADAIEDGVDVGTLLLLFGGVGRLEDEYCLSGDK